MSLFSYIAFPREVDTSCLISNVDESKKVTVGELKGTELECLYQGLPDEMPVYLGDSSDFWGVQIFELDFASFNGVFKNDFVYCLDADFTFRDLKEAIDSGMKSFHYCKGMKALYYLTEADKWTEEECMEGIIKGYNDTKKRVTLCRQQLYDVVQRNMHPGETVEIYSVWVHGDECNFGPPVGIKSIYVEQIPISESLDLEDNVKLEIHRSK